MMRIIFMGTPDFAVPALGALLDAGHEVVAVYTQPPRAAGRGLGLKKSPVHLFAESKGLPVLTPASLRSEEEQARFKSFNADAAVVVAYGLILPKAMLNVPRFGCFNIHASLLPRWRGAAPIQRAIMAGDAETGVAIMRIEEGLDTGAICLAERTPIWPTETAGELHDRLALIGAGLMVKALGDLAKGSLACWPQHEEGVTYAAKIEPSETRIDWSQAGKPGAVSNPRSFAPSRRLVRDGARRQARARPRPPRDPCRWRGQSRHAARRQAHHCLWQGRRAPYASAARRQAPNER